MILRLLCALFIAMLSPAWVLAQEAQVRAERILDKSGLPLNGVNAIIQDKQGFIWFGTTGSLERYDGYRFHSFRYDPKSLQALSIYQVTVLSEDSVGGIWAGSILGGLNRIDKRTGRVTRIPFDPNSSTGLLDDRVVAILTDGNGLVWVATHSGICNINPSNLRVRRFSQKEMQVPSTVSSTSMYIDRSGTLWATSHDRRSIGSRNDAARYLSQYDTASQSFTTKVIIEQAVDALILGELLDGRLIIGHRQGTRPTGPQMYLFNTKTESVESVDFSMLEPHDAKQYPLALLDGQLWTAKAAGARDRRGVHLRFTLHIDTIKVLPRVSVVPGAHLAAESVTGHITSVLRDRNHGTWIGTNEGCFYVRANARGITTWTHDENDATSLSNSRIRAVLVDRKQRLWVGTDFGLNRRQAASEGWTRYYADASRAGSILNSTVNTIYEDRDGTILLGTNGGVSRYDDRHDSFRDGIDGLELPTDIAMRVWSFLRDSKGCMWIGTYGAGLARIDPQTHRTQWFHSSPTDSTSILDGGIWDLHEDRAGNIWVGTNAGLCRWLPASQSFKRYTHDPMQEHSLPGARNWVILEDRNSDLWVTSFAHGLARYRRDRDDFVTYTQRDGLMNNEIVGLVEGYRGLLWLSTTHGLVRWNPQTQSAQTFDLKDGLQGNEFTFGAYHAAADGTLYFGGTTGLSSINPRAIVENTVPPQLSITGFRLFDSLAATELRDGDTIRLNHGQNFFSFEFAALDFTNPGKNRYAYMLEGIDATWINSDGDHRYAGYTNLAPGTYTFRVRGSNNDGVWNDKGIAITVVIEPPWYGTWMFRTGAFLFVCFVVVGGMRLRNNGIRKHEREKHLSAVQATLESQEAERQRIARDLHDGIGQLLAAAVINLTRARDNIERARTQPPTSDTPTTHPQEDILAPLDRTAWILQRTSNDVRALSHALGTSTLREQGLTIALAELLEYMQAQESTRFDFIDTGLDARLPESVEIGLFRVAQELITNILRHAKATDATVQLIQDASEIRLSIEDNGIGFDVNSKHTGMGLRNIASRVAAIGGELHYDSTPGHGTTVTVVVRT